MTYECPYAGNVHGVLRVTGWSWVTYRYRGVALTKLRCVCTRCGAASVLTKHELERLGKRGARSCDSCASRGHGDGLVRSAGYICTHCCDLPHRRLRVGLCRGCGKAYRDDSIPPAEMYRGRSNIADCEAVG